MVPGWVYGVGRREGYTGVLPSHLESGGSDSEAGPGTLQGVEWVVTAAACARALGPPTPLRYGARSAVLGLSPGKCASGPIKARLRSISQKLSQNPRVSPKYHEKASHSPCFQNGPQMSPLDFLGFPFSSAFSGKELMGLF